MNNKIIAAGVVVALCAVALIGVGYAYTATVEDTNTLNSEYVVLTINGRGVNNYAEAIFSGNVQMNTVTTTSGTEWTAKAQTIASNGSYLKITSNNVSGPITLGLYTRTTDGSLLSGLIGVGSTIIFKQYGTIGDNGTTVTALENQQTAPTVTFTRTSGSEGGYDVWSTDDTFLVNGVYSASLATIQVPFGTTAPNSTFEFSMMLKYEQNSATN